jgi:hypothetical protein
MPKRSQHRVSEGRMPKRTSGDGARAAPNRERSVFAEHARRVARYYDALTGSAVHCVPSRTTRW